MMMMPTSYPPTSMGVIVLLLVVYAAEGRNVVSFRNPLVASRYVLLDDWPTAGTGGMTITTTSSSVSSIFRNSNRLVLFIFLILLFVLGLFGYGPRRTRPAEAKCCLRHNRFASATEV